MKVTYFCLIVISLSCCSTKEAAVEIEEYAVMENSPSMEEVAQVSFAPPPPIENTRKLIREGSLAFEVRNVNHAYDSIKLIINDLHGYFSDEETTNNEQQIEQRIVIRIEEKYFDDVIERVLALAGKVESRSITIHDVTEQYTDITARLKAKKEVELRYVEILRQAKTVKDMLAIEEQLGAAREEIESMQAQMKLMSSQVAYSTIRIRFSEHIVTVQESGPSMGSRVVFSVQEGWNNLMSLMLAVVALWPFILGIGSLFVIVIRFIRRRRKVVAADPVIG